MTEIVIRNGLVVTDTSAEVRDVLVRNGKIAEVGVNLVATSDAQEIDATGCWVGPGFVDLHTHLREPGREEAETIASGANAGVVGGFTALVAMPNTEPALDSVPMVSFVLEKGAQTQIDIAVAGAITVNRAGEHLAPIAELAELGVRLFTDDGTGVQNPSLMRRALTYAKPLGVRLAQHCEDEQLANGGSMNEGELSSRLGLIGRPALAEELMVLRDIELVRLTGAPLHFLHLSTARSIQMVAAAKAEGLPVTCEVAPHHLVLDEEACASFDPLFKVHPPLRSKSDAAALREALKAGVIDAVATDHAPHAPELKDLVFDEAPAGMLSLEHVAAITYEVVGDDPVRFYDVLSRGPAAIAQLRNEDDRVRHTGHGSTMKVGDDANVTVFDPSLKWTVDKTNLQSRATNTPYEGRELRGKAVHVLAKGRLVLDQGVLV